jgi:hypothetical protein
VSDDGKGVVARCHSQRSRRLNYKWHAAAPAPKFTCCRCITALAYIQVPDCHGRAEFTFEQDVLQLDGRIRGTVHLLDIARPIVAAHVIVIRTEILGGTMFEVRQCYCCCMG